MLRPKTLKVKRAAIAFLLAYIAITILGTLMTFGIAAVWHTPRTAQPLENQAYLLSEPFLPFLNLLVWMAGSWLYFRSSSHIPRTLASSVPLGIFWLAIALPLDFVGFVVIKTPLSLTVRDFYVGQFPWIYLIYLAVFIGPMCYTGMGRILKGAAAHG